jgi:gas vesicle protein
MTVGSLTGAVVGGLIGCAAGGVTGARLGAQLDDKVLDNHQSSDCDYTFRPPEQ